MSARRVASVSAEAVRPTGPAATDASAPSFTLLVRIPLAPRSFITSSTKSVASPPIWKPKLPPSRAIMVGAPQDPLAAANNEGGLQHGREDNHTIGFVEQVLGDVVRNIENLFQHCVAVL